MTSLLPLLPSVALLGGAIIAVMIEVLGAPPGARKVIQRGHLSWLVGAACAAAAWGARVAFAGGSIDAVAAVGAVVIAAGVLLTHVSAADFLRNIDEERGELTAAYLLFGAGMCAAVTTTDLLTLGAGLTLATGAGVFLAAPDREGPHGIEAAARLITSFGLLLAVIIIAAAFSALDGGGLGLAGSATGAGSNATLPLLLVVMAAIAGAAPLHSRFVDVAHGAASSATGLFASTGLIAGSALAVRLVERSAAAGGQPFSAPLAAIAAVTLIGVPLAALAQIRVGRLVAYLAAAQAGVPLVALASAAGPAERAVAFGAAVVGAAAACAALLGVTLATRHPAATWEDWSGFGRSRPVIAALFIYALATCAGMPGTPGFVARLAVARVAFMHGDAILGLVAVGSVAFAAAPVVRLALFLFAKEEAGGRGDGARPAVAFVVLVGGCALLAAQPWLFGALVDVLTRG